MDLTPLIPIGAGIITIGASISISKIGYMAIRSISRQPEMENAIRSTMIIAAALIEGIALFSLVICIILSIK